MNTYQSSKPGGFIPRPHDLLWLANTAGLSSACPLPSWATSDWLAGAPAVMRREKVNDPDCIPVGLRGTTRSERFKAYLSAYAVKKCVQPEQLATAEVWRGLHQATEFPAIKALGILAPALDASGLAWGPTGGVGFTLASGLPVLRLESDLDLIVRAPKPLTADQTQLLLKLRASPICRIDIQIDTGCGAFSLAEWANGHSQVLLKTDLGPYLTDDPWCHFGPTTTNRISRP